MLSQFRSVAARTASRGVRRVSDLAQISSLLEKEDFANAAKQFNELTPAKLRAAKHPQATAAQLAQPDSGSAPEQPVREQSVQAAQAQPAPRSPATGSILRQSLNQFQKFYMGLPEEELKRRLPELFQIHAKCLELGCLSRERATELMLTAVKLGVPERAVELWVQILESLNSTNAGATYKAGKRIQQPVGEIVGRANFANCSIAALAAYYMACMNKGVPSDPKTALKLVPVGAVPTGLGSIAHLKGLPKDMVAVVRKGFKELRQHMTDYNSPQFCESVERANFGELRTLYGEALEQPELPEKVFASFIRRFAETRQTDRAFKVWNDMVERGVKPTTASWAALLRAGSLMVENSATIVQQLWERMQADGVKPDAGCYSARIESLARNGDITNAVRLYSELETGDPKNLDVVAMNVVVNALVKQRMFDEAQKLVARAPAGLVPNNVTYNTFIRSAIAAGDAERASGYLDAMREKGLVPDIITYSNVLDMLFKRGRKLHQDVAGPVDALLKEMRAQRITPNAQFYTILAHGISRMTQSVEQSRRLFDSVVRHNVNVNVETFGALIDSELAYGDLNVALRYFNMMPRFGLPPSSSTYNQLIRGALRRDRVDVALSLFDKMLQSDARAQPNKFTFMFLLEPWKAEDLQGPAARGDAVELVGRALTELTQRTGRLDFVLARRVQALSRFVSTPAALLEAAERVQSAEFDPRIGIYSRT